MKEKICPTCGHKSEVIKISNIKNTNGGDMEIIEYSNGQFEYRISNRSEEWKVINVKPYNK